MIACYNGRDGVFVLQFVLAELRLKTMDTLEHTKACMGILAFTATARPIVAIGLT